MSWLSLPQEMRILMLPDKVTMVEVGARDGLQNETGLIAVADKVRFVNLLSATGLPVIEVGSFVSPRRVPQLAETGRLFADIEQRPGVRYPVLVPNAKGLQAAMAAGARDIAFFAAASETFSQRNINCSILQSLTRLEEIAAVALPMGLRIRGYLSCVAGCPYEGAIAVDAVAELAARLIELGCYEVSLGDTIGVGSPGTIRPLLEAVLRQVPGERLAVHFHDTYGQALANILVALEAGIAVVDSSVAGLGGCPYAPGATGNVASEDVLYMLQGLGIETGVSLDALIEAGLYVSRLLNRLTGSRVARARDVARDGACQPDRPHAQGRCD